MSGPSRLYGMGVGLLVETVHPGCGGRAYYSEKRPRVAECVECGERFRRSRARIVAVTVHRAEGLVWECGTWTCEGEEAEALADQRLWAISRTAPENGGYHKCDVTTTVALPGGAREVIETRHDIQYLNTDSTVRGHVLRFLDYYAVHARHEPPEERRKAARLANFLRLSPAPKLCRCGCRLQGCWVCREGRCGGPQP